MSKAVKTIVSKEDFFDIKKAPPKKK